MNTLVPCRQSNTKRNWSVKKRSKQSAEENNDKLSKEKQIVPMACYNER